MGIYTRLVCDNCLLVSSDHAGSCKRCGYNKLSNIDEFVELCNLNERNRELILKLEDLLGQVKSSVKHFDKAWGVVWDSAKDVDFHLPCEDEMEDFSLHFTE